MKSIVVMPAYNAGKTIAKTLDGIPKVYERIILCDDASTDDTVAVSRSLNIETLEHKINGGYGRNQKTLYKRAFEYNPDVVIMIHPDNQYSTKCILEMIELINKGSADMVLGSRMKTATKNGMPLWKYISNRFLTFMENLAFHTKLSEFHSGLRAYNVQALRSIDYERFSDDFVFDTEMIAAFVANKKKIREVDTECFYTDEVSSINFRRSVKYGLMTLKVLFDFKIHKRF